MQQGQTTAKKFSPEQKGRPRTDTANTSNPSYQSSLSTPRNRISSILLIRVLWKYETTSETQSTTLLCPHLANGRNRMQIGLKPVIQTKHITVINYKTRPTENTMSALRTARSMAQRSCQTLRQRLLAKIWSEHSALIRHQKRTRHVLMNTERSWASCKENSAFEICDKRDFRRLQQTNGEMGRALLQRNCCHKYNPGWCRGIASHGGAQCPTNFRRSQWSH